MTSSSDFLKLLALSKNRGPDATETYKEKNFQLGFNRLAILDVSKNGDQPKVSPSGRYYVLFNGELYNYKKLQEIYQLKNLKSSSDTEVLIHLLDELGIENTINSLNGMFAIAIVDLQNNTMTLTRDFAGIKPLFFGLGTEGVVCASQFDQVFKHSWFIKNLELQPEVVKEYFGFGYMQAPNTIYKSIFQVNPGELIQIDNAGSVFKKTLVAFKRTLREQLSKTALSTILQNAVSKQLASDVPIATFLSGGIDSPLISAYAKKHITEIAAFTLEVENPKFNESLIAKAYAEHLNIKQNIVRLKEKDLLLEIDAHFGAYSDPFGDYSSIPTYVISKEARKSHTVMLSGDGGDELFFGYPRMLDVLQKRWWFKIPYAIRKPLARVTNKLGLTKTWAPHFKSLDDFIISKHLKIPIGILNDSFPRTTFSKSMDLLYKFKNSNRTKLLHELRWNEFYAHLQRVLIKVDRASMAHSLEVRVPFLDKNVIEWAWENPTKLTCDGDLKKILKSLLSDEVDKNIINQKKSGFTVPLNVWLHEYLKSDVLQLVFNQPFYGEHSIDVSVLRRFVLDFFDHKHNNAWGVWHIYAWQKWADIHVKASDF